MSDVGRQHTTWITRVELPGLSDRWTCYTYDLEHNVEVVRASDYDALVARLARAERVINDAREAFPEHLECGERHPEECSLIREEGPTTALRIGEFLRSLAAYEKC